MPSLTKRLASRRMQRLSAAICLVLAAALLGCGGSDETGSQSPSEADAKQQEAQIEREFRDEAQSEKRAKEKATQKAASKPKAESAPEPESESETSSSKFTGAQANRYQEDKEICSLFPPSQVAKEFGLPAGSDEATIAEAYADGYQPAFHQAAFEGCLDGMLGRE